MKIVNSSVHLVSYRQLVYLLAVAFLVTIAFGSNEVERSSRSEENVRYTCISSKVNMLVAYLSL